MLPVLWITTKASHRWIWDATVTWAMNIKNTLKCHKIMQCFISYTRCSDIDCDYLCLTIWPCWQDWDDRAHIFLYKGNFRVTLLTRLRWPCSKIPWKVNFGVLCCWLDQVTKYVSDVHDIMFCLTKMLYDNVDLRCTVRFIKM